MSKFDENNGLIFNIQKFSIHDGEGIRTLIFMKGCPLRCLWCCNPESQSFEEELLFVRTKCIGCGICVEACPEHAISKEGFMIDREKCTVCGGCAGACVANSKKKVGKWIKRSEIVEEIEKDRIIYKNSGGGVTIGGGEPVCQPEFVGALLKECQLLSINTAIETCGYGEWDRIKGIFDYLDQIFMDLKCMDPKQHKKLTGVNNELILQNAKNIASLKKNVTFRLPLIPGCNDSEENVKATARFVSTLGNNVKLEILGYHRLGEDKFKWMDRDYALKGATTQPKEIKDRMNSLAESCGCKVVR